MAVPAACACTNTGSSSIVACGFKARRGHRCKILIAGVRKPSSTPQGVPSEQQPPRCHPSTWNPKPVIHPDPSMLTEGQVNPLSLASRAGGAQGCESHNLFLTKHDGTLGGALLPFSRSAASEPQPTAVPWHEHTDDDHEWTSTWQKPNPAHVLDSKAAKVETPFLSADHSHGTFR